MSAKRRKKKRNSILLSLPTTSENSRQAMALPVKAEVPPNGNSQTSTVATPSLTTANLELILQFSGDVLEKRYNIYGWCETKVNNLIALNGLLLAAIFVVVGFSAKQPLDSIITLGQYISIAGAILFLCVSLFQALAHIRPKMNSGTGTGGNPRSVIGTVKHNNWGSYEQHIKGMTVEGMISCNAEQIYGMSYNIIRNDRAIRSAAFFSIIGLMFFLIAIILTFYANAQ